MKKLSKILYSIAGVFFLFGLNSCNEDFLDVTQYDIVNLELGFNSDAAAQKSLISCYDMMLPNDETDGDWGIKPNLFIGGHPTMDTQATGWDKDWNKQNWNPGSPELLTGWKHAYKAISRCNSFLENLDKATEVTPAVKTSLDGQARCIRSFYYMWLAKAFGRVPMLATGETYLNTPEKARAANYEEMWDFIIDDLKVAATELDTVPQNKQYGRCTKGFALSYLGEAYMWKAYRVPTKATENYTLAAATLLEVIESGVYRLNPSFTTLFDPGAVWTREAIWEEVLDQGANNWTGANLDDARNWMIQFVACGAVGGWGTLYLSWEWWSCYEPGDKRRDASACTGSVPGMPAEWTSPTNTGINPYLAQNFINAESGLTSHYKYSKNGEAAPSVWTLKYWRTTRSDYKASWAPQQIYYKRYANVLFDYAECLFHLNGGEDATAWGIINQIRDRAWGNLEVGKEASLTATYLPYYQELARFYQGKGTKDFPVPSTYPLPFSTVVNPAPDAEIYYTQEKADKGFSSPVWLVALGQERRKEFNAEWCLAQDLIRSGFIEDHIRVNYPKGFGVPNTDPTVSDNYHTYRDFDFNLQKMDMPIPTDEILKNPLCDQNDAYK